MLQFASSELSANLRPFRSQHRQGRSEPPGCRVGTPFPKRRSTSHATSGKDAVGCARQRRGNTLKIELERIQERKHQILEVRWMPPDPNDHSKLIEPEPD